MIRWLARLPLAFLAVLLRYPLAFVAVAFRDVREGPVNNNSAVAIEPRCPKWLSWLDTNDNSLYGDDGHKARVGDFTSDWAMVRWLWRNGAHEFNYDVIGCDFDKKWEDENWPTAPIASYWKRPDGYWLYRRFIPVSSKQLELFFGWNLFGNVRGRCKWVCTIRVKTQ